MSDAQPDRRKSILRRFLSVSSGYWTGAQKWRSGTLLAAMILLGFLQVALAVRLNLWSADLFDALERHSTEGFLSQVGIFALLVAGIMLVNMLHLSAKRGLQMGWREWLTQHVLGNWMADARHYQISLLPGDHDNPDGRIADDIRIATEATIDLAHSGLYCLMLFASFVTILWSLSGVVDIDIAGYSLSIHGHMVWLALLYAGIGSALAFLVGGRLVDVANKRQTAEADFRFALAEARENAEAIALVRRESQERRRMTAVFQSIRRLWDDQTVGLRRLMLFSSAYSVLATMFPILVASPRYLAGSITLGVLMQTGQAFQQLTAALSWPIDNFPRIAEWHASAERVLALHDAVGAQKAAAGHVQAGIQISATAGPGLAIRDLAIASPSNGTLATGISAEIEPGERVLITGDTEVGLMLFKAVTGIWLWGAGVIELPDNADIVFLPQKPYLPPETLRALLTYPDGPSDSRTDDACRAALDQVGLGALQDRLDAVEDWMHSLAPADQQRLACANLLLRRPRWAFLSHATESLEEVEELALLKVIFEALPDTTFLTLSHRAGLEAFHSRKILIERRQDDKTITIRDEGLGLAMRRAGRGRGGIQRLLEYIKEGLS